MCDFNLRQQAKFEANICVHICTDVWNEEIQNISVENPIKINVLEPCHRIEGYLFDGQPCSLCVEDYLGAVRHVCEFVISNERDQFPGNVL